METVVCDYEDNMNQSPGLPYEAICQYVGQLFLETRHQFEQLSAENFSLRQRVTQLEDEKQKTLSLLPKGRVE